MLKFISENKIRTFLESKNFLLFCSTTILLFSIFLRSIMDIGSDTGVYINLGKKIANGGKYYYDFFESNFPISFYFYALQYQLSNLFHIDPIITSEIFVNLLGFSSIFWSAKILKNSTISDNKIHYNLLVISFFLSFFLRPYAVQIAEFGTKTSLLLLALFPYLSFSFARKTALKKSELFCRGLMMGLIPCFKPHYLFLIIFIEIYRFFESKKFISFFLELDKLVMFLVGISYLVFMIKFTPEFFEFMVPMWSQTYSAYGNISLFLDNLSRHTASRIGVFGFIFLIFSRLKIDENDKVLLLLFIGASFLVILENIGTVDQVTIFYIILTICFSKLFFDFLTSKEFQIESHKFITAALIFVPAFDMDILPVAVFGLGGIANIWWFVLPFYFFSARKKNPEIRIFPPISFYFLMLAIAVLSLRYLGGWAYISINLPFLFLSLFYFEKKINSKNSTEFSPLTVLTIIGAFSCLFYSYILTSSNPLRQDSAFANYQNYFNPVAYYAKKFAPKNSDEIMVSSIWIANRFPILNYLNKEDHAKFHITGIRADRGKVGNNLMFPINNLDGVFTFSYLFDDLKNQLKNPNTKLFLVDNGAEELKKPDSCLIGNLEYYFLDPAFKKIFFENFHFENHLIVVKDVKPIGDVRFLSHEDKGIYKNLKPTTKKIVLNYEIYVRNEN
jgi:hypothetical protein